jgi:chromosome segregation ATPase
LLQATAEVPATAEGGAAKERVARLAKEAEDMAVKLEAAVSELAERKKESDHIHDLLKSRSDRSDQRILHLEHNVNVLQYDFTTISSKLSFLRVQLKALEVEGQRYIPFNADAELSTSIRNWKLEWADVDMRTKKAKRRCDDALASSQEGKGTGSVSRESSFTSVG